MTAAARTNSLVVLLGAHEFPECALKPADAFLLSHQKVKEYFLSPSGFALAPHENLLDLFDTKQTAPEIYKAIVDWLRERLSRGAASGARISDLFVYYVGHGGLGHANNAYYLAIQATQEYDRFSHSISLYALAAILRNYARDLRRYMILDSCFAASAVDDIQSDLNGVVEQQVKGTGWSSAPALASGVVPGEAPAVQDSPGGTRGTSLLCASSKTDPARFGRDGTYFSKALVEVLARGARKFSGGGHAPVRLSLRQVTTLVADYIRHNVPEDDQVFPQVHSPDQPDGVDIADDAIFPNPLAEIRVRPAVPLKVIGALAGHEMHVDCVAWSADGTRLATGSYDNTARVWSAAGQQCVHVFRGHDKGVSDLAWGAGAEGLLATASYDGTVRLWQLGREEVWRVAGHRGQVRCVAWTSGDRVIASGDEASVHLWALATRSALRHYPSGNAWVNSLAFSPACNDGKGLLAVGLGDGNVLLRDPLARESNKALRAHHQYVNAVAWKPGSDLLCSGAGSGTIGVWDIARGQSVKKLNSHSDRVYRLSFSADGALMASIGQDRMIIWRTRDWEAVHTVTGPFPSKTFLPLAFAPTGTLLAMPAADDQKQVQLVEVTAGD